MDRTRHSVSIDDEELTLTPTELYSNTSGTSWAAAHVSGVAVLLKDAAVDELVVIERCPDVARLFLDFNLVVSVSGVSKLHHKAPDGRPEIAQAPIDLVGLLTHLEVDAQLFFVMLALFPVFVLGEYYQFQR